MNLYSIYNEDGDKMRVVRRLEEAKTLIANKPDWTYKCVRQPKQEPALHNFEEALF